MITLTFRQLDAWPAGRTATPAPSRVRGPFRMTYERIKAELLEELRKLGAREVVLLADADAAQFTRYGELRVDAKMRGPGIVLRFVDSDDRRQEYACDTYQHWHDNLRAIGLTLEALRGIDRWGAIAKGAQYEGMKALPAQAGQGMTAEAAAALLVAYHPLARHLTAGAVLDDGRVFTEAVRAARAETHPDKTGGDRARYDQVETARQVLEARHATRSGGADA